MRIVDDMGLSKPSRLFLSDDDDDDDADDDADDNADDNDRRVDDGNFLAILCGHENGPTAGASQHLARIQESVIMMMMSMMRIIMRVMT